MRCSQLLAGSSALILGCVLIGRPASANIITIINPVTNDPIIIADGGPLDDSSDANVVLYEFSFTAARFTATGRLIGDARGGAATTVLTNLSIVNTGGGRVIDNLRFGQIFPAIDPPTKTEATLSGQYLNTLDPLIGLAKATLKPQIDAGSLGVISTNPAEANFVRGPIDFTGSLNPPDMRNQAVSLHAITFNFELRDRGDAIRMRSTNNERIFVRTTVPAAGAPEPATVSMLLVGATVLLAYRRVAGAKRA